MRDVSAADVADLDDAATFAPPPAGRSPPPTPFSREEADKE